MFYTHVDRMAMHLDWLKQKIQLEAISKKASKRKVQRGHVYMCDLGRGVGSEQEKERPCVIIQNQDGNDTSPNVIVAPITHTKSKLDIVIPIETKYDDNGNILLDGNALLGNIVTVSKARLGNEVSELNKNEMKLIDEAIMKSLGIYTKFELLEKRIKDKDAFILKLKNEIKELKEKSKND